MVEQAQGTKVKVPWDVGCVHKEGVRSRVERYIGHIGHVGYMGIHCDEKAGHSEASEQTKPIPRATPKRSHSPYPGNLCTGPAAHSYWTATGSRQPAGRCYATRLENCHSMFS